MTRIAILGSTGSIGTSALSVVDTHPGRLEVVALAAGNNVQLFAEQVRKYLPAGRRAGVGQGSRGAEDAVRRASRDRRRSRGPDRGGHLP